MDIEKATFSMGGVGSESEQETNMKEAKKKTEANPKPNRRCETLFKGSELKVLRFLKTSRFPDLELKNIFIMDFRLGF
jgi:hypothetical protein